MKVLISGRFILPRMEGVGRYTREIIVHLSKLYPDHEIHVVVDRNYQPDWLKGKNITVHVSFPPARHPFLWRLWYEVSIPRLVERIKPDVVFFPEGFLSKRIQKPTVMTVHDLSFIHHPLGMYRSHRRYLDRNFPDFVEQATHLVAVSRFTADDLVQQFSITSEKTSVIHHGVGQEFRVMTKDEKSAFRASCTGGAPYFIYLGAMHPRKNVERLIEAFEQYKDHTSNSMKLVLAGRLAWKSDLIKRKMLRSRHKEDIIYESELEGKIPSMIGAASAMCYVSLLEGFGLPVLEAMACGVPVITSKGTAMQEVCDQAAIYVDALDVDKIASAMIEVVKEDVSQHLILKALQRSQHFQWQNSVHQLEKVLRQAAL